MATRVRWEKEVPQIEEPGEMTNGKIDEEVAPKMRKSNMAGRRKHSPVPEFICSAIRRLSGALDHHHANHCSEKSDLCHDGKHADEVAADAADQSAAFSPSNSRRFRHLDSGTEAEEECECDPLLLGPNKGNNESEPLNETCEHKQQSMQFENKDDDNKRPFIRLTLPHQRMATSPSSVSFVHHQESISDLSSGNAKNANASNKSHQEPPHNARGRSLSAIENMIAESPTWRQHGKLSTVDTLSCLYGILLVVMGAAFPISQIISHSIPSHYYEGFYAYLYFVAIGLFFYVYILLRVQINWDVFVLQWQRSVKYIRNKIGQEVNSGGDDNDEQSQQTMAEIMTNKLRATLNKELDPTRSANRGSFYLRMGAVVFGVGAMIYSALEFGQYFEMSRNPLCDDIMLAVQPFARMLFTFFQMYFVFLNAKLQFIKSSNVIVSRFGLMHLVATNLCVWLNVIVQETRHEIMHFTSHDDHHHAEKTGHASLVDEHHGPLHEALNSSIGNHRASLHLVRDDRVPGKRSLSDECQRTDLMGTLTQNASPFLFPCAIEYSLICAAIMYEIWKHGDHGDHQHGIDVTQHSSVESLSGARTPRNSGSGSSRRSPHHYSVDCTNANKGLFFGIFVLVMTIVAMIFFFVLVTREEYRQMAITEIHLSELFLYVVTLGAVIIGITQVSQLHFDASKKLDLDNTLLVVALTGVISYNVFTIIATHFSEHGDRLLVLMNAMAAVVQATAQTIFVIGASKRHLYSRRQQQKKPGREAITFLIVTNFSMWAIITLEKSRIEAHPVQNDFYGLWPWTIISNISSPLSIFFRYHSTVCLGEIWKRCYKVQDKPRSPSSPHQFHI